MKKVVGCLPLQEALRQASADLRLENAAIPEWGRHIFARVESGHLSLLDARREIDHEVRLRLHKA